MVVQVLVEQSLLGWKEYELEVMRDLADNVVIVCSIENVDPMGVHTGDSITVAPQQTLTDKEYQRLRDASVEIIREMGVECGGSNVQLATDPVTGEMVIIEMNPRVSRSSALASKATGFPIAKMAAKLAMGMTLDQIPNDITQCVSPSGGSCIAPSLVQHAHRDAVRAGTTFRPPLWVLWPQQRAVCATRQQLCAGRGIPREASITSPVSSERATGQGAIARMPV